MYVMVDQVSSVNKLENELLLLFVACSIFTFVSLWFCVSVRVFLGLGFGDVFSEIFFTIHTCFFRFFGVKSVSPWTARGGGGGGLGGW
jgi:hypothetical protein